MEMEIHARIGYRNRDDPEDAWTEIDRSVESRQLDCSIDEVKEAVSCLLCPVLIGQRCVSCRFTVYPFVCLLVW